MFSDINPVDPEDEFPHQVVRICYSQEFKDCFDYFRSISEKLEYSPRALQLTEDCIRQNPANYTVWEYRRRIIKLRFNYVTFIRDFSYVETMIRL